MIWCETCRAFVERFGSTGEFCADCEALRDEEWYREQNNDWKQDMEHS